MLLIKTVVKHSAISGLGLFADQDISKGSLIWKFEAKLDSFFPLDEFENLPETVKEQLLSYAFYDKSRKGFIICGDDARFFNHSELPNCDETSDDITIAIGNIKRGEELTVDYRVFDGKWERHKFLR